MQLSNLLIVSIIIAGNGQVWHCHLIQQFFNFNSKGSAGSSALNAPRKVVTAEARYECVHLVAQCKHFGALNVLAMHVYLATATRGVHFE